MSLIAGILIGCLAAAVKHSFTVARERDRLRAALVATAIAGAEDYRMLTYGICAELGVGRCEDIERTGRTGPWASMESMERYATLLDQRADGNAWPVFDA